MLNRKVEIVICAKRFGVEGDCKSIIIVKIARSASGVRRLFDVLLGADHSAPPNRGKAIFCITVEAMRIFASIGRGRMIGP